VPYIVYYDEDDLVMTSAISLVQEQAFPTYPLNPKQADGRITLKVAVGRSATNDIVLPTDVPRIGIAFEIRGDADFEVDVEAVIVAERTFSTAYESIDANIDMQGYRHINVGQGTSQTDYARIDQAQGSMLSWCDVAGGTADALTLSPTPALTSYTRGQRLRFFPSATNTGPVTVDVSGLGVKPVLAVAGELKPGTFTAGKMVEVVYDGVSFQLLRSSLAVCVDDFDAVGDGVSDDTAAIQNALSSGAAYVYLRHGASYYLSSELRTPNGITFDGTGATLLRSWEDVSPVLVNDNYDSTWDNTNIALINLKGRGTGGAYHGSFVKMIGVDNLVVRGMDWYMQLPGLGVAGANGLEISGKNISVTGCLIDTYGGGKWADGIHVTYVENCLISDCILLAGDDCIGASFRPFDWTTAGKKLASRGLTVTNLVCSSKIANAVRIGASTTTHQDQVFKDVLVDNIVVYVARDAAQGGRRVMLEDEREAVDIADQHTNITLRNIRCFDTGLAGNVGFLGNADVTDAAKTNRNYGRVELVDSKFTIDDAGTHVYGGGVEQLIIRDSTFEMAVAAPAAGAQTHFYEIGYLKLENCVFNFETTGSAMSFTRVDEIEAVNTDFLGSGNEFTLLNWNTNTAPAQRVRILGGSFRDAARAFRIVGSDTFADVLVFGTDFENITIADFGSYTATRDQYKPLNRLVTSDGASGGAGSAGAGNQYIAMDPGTGTAYKFLHDGPA